MPDPGCAEAHCARAWPFEAVYNATGYGDYPFWTGDALPGRQSGLATSSSGAHIHTTWSAVVNAEKLEHGSCSLSSINAGFSADGPCTHLMLGTHVGSCSASNVTFSREVDELMDSLVWAETFCDSHGYGAFQRFWSAKESFVKARGDGLAFNVGRAGFTFQSHPAVGEEGTAAVGYVEVDGESLWQWTFHQIGFGDDHWITVARGPTQDVVDEIGDFRRTFLRPTPTFRAHDWSAELDCASPQFCEVPVSEACVDLDRHLNVTWCPVQ